MFRSAESGEELPDVRGQGLGLFECGEVTATVLDVGPPRDRVFLFGVATDADVVGEDDDRGRDRGRGFSGAPG
ncbi:hypothetical protein Pd630_LPD01242 [Rhodococcus opacus PD630]|nr:hypothetical protein Pd630_LPD01242 [Rhodococcus opacus PD630]